MQSLSELEFDSIVAALRPDLGSELEKDKWNRQHCNANEA